MSLTPDYVRYEKTKNRHSGHFCPYCGKEMLEPGHNPYDNGLNPFVNWDNASTVCSVCDKLVVQTNRIIKRIIVEKASENSLNALKEHIDEILKNIDSSDYD